MQQTVGKWLVPIIGVLLVLAACTSQQGANNHQNGTTHANQINKSINDSGKSSHLESRLIDEESLTNDINTLQRKKAD
ncbi:hypothetical protein [Heyndrickxia sporothermodurans]|uniref:Lipoprotein n=1 Tax=Heyndrickxia sporothermodurans TaxID=46224 RepID=A0A150L9E0_9BACI|nr:hypothetical protein [Heyndrickxia sporothermodurans]KYD08860.1 hypothetical protein B4102_1867 [Heyndrickxia sporothermodurans]MED3652043.1 hypothetical protein [Heyndrickxia sporothermodurans]MED3697570.1 hypothetical protein [Heyndrickxia sporothermodurans]